MITATQLELPQQQEEPSRRDPTRIGDYLEHLAGPIEPTVDHAKRVIDALHRDTSQKGR